MLALETKNARFDLHRPTCPAYMIALDTNVAHFGLPCPTCPADIIAVESQVARLDSTRRTRPTLASLAHHIVAPEIKIACVDLAP